MVCVSVRKDNPQALESGLSKYRRKTIKSLVYCTSIHLHFVHCEAVDVIHCNINDGCNLSHLQSAKSQTSLIISTI